MLEAVPVPWAGYLKEIAMRRRATVVICLLALVAGIAGGPAIAAPATDLRVTLSTDKVSLSATEDVVLRVDITNVANHPVHVLKWNTPVDGVEGALFRVARDSLPVTYLGAVYKRPAATGRDYVKLAPGETLSRLVALTGLYDFSETGAYAIRYSTGALGLVSDRAGPPAGPRAVDSLSSNTVYLWIEGHDMGLLAKAGGGGGGSKASCTSAQQTVVGDAKSAAKKYSAEALTYLSGRSVTTRYITWFGTYSSSRWDGVRLNFQGIDGAVSGIKSDCSCRKNYYAYVYPNDASHTVYLCNVFWSAPLTGTDSKAGTLIHETSHFTDVAGTDDYVYGQSGAKSLAISDPDKAVNNADNHEYFAENAPSLN